MVWQIRERADSPPTRSTTSLNSWRSSALLIASRLAPIISTPNSSRVPFSARAIAAFSAVWPPRVGRTASGRSLAMIERMMSGSIGSM
jgi:hypothetical protein